MVHEVSATYIGQEATGEWVAHATVDGQYRHLAYFPLSPTSGEVEAYVRQWLIDREAEEAARLAQQQAVQEAQGLVGAEAEDWEVAGAEPTASFLLTLVPRGAQQRVTVADEEARDVTAAVRRRLVTRGEVLGHLSPGRRQKLERAWALAEALLRGDRERGKAGVEALVAEGLVTRQEADAIKAALSAKEAQHGN